MSYNFLKVRIEDRVGWIEYNRPPINSFNWEMLREVPAALDDLLKQPQARVVVLPVPIKSISAPERILKYLMASVPKE